MTIYAIQTARLSKRYGNQQVLSNVSLHVRQGEVYGLLGAANAGKTTLLQVLTGLVRPSSGEIALFDQPMQGHAPALLKRIGALIGTPNFYEHLSVAENLDLHANYLGYYNRNALNDSLERFRLGDVRDTPVRKLALDQKQRLALARATFTQPELLLLDQPVNGLDPFGIRDLRQLLRQLNQEFGTTILLAGHLLNEIEQLADTIGVLKNGALIEEVALDTLRSAPTVYIEIVTSEPSRACFVLEQQLAIRQFRLHDEKRLRIYDTERDANQILRALVLQDIPIELFQQRTQTLEEYILQLSHEGRRDAAVDAA